MKKKKWISPQINFMQAFLRIIAFVFVGIALGNIICLLFTFVIFRLVFPQIINLRPDTYSVNSDVATTLCQNDAIPTNIADCSDENLLLRLWQIRDITESYIEDNLTYDDLTNLIGDFEVACNLPDRPPLPNTFRCAYEFDVGYTLVFVFDDLTERLLDIE